MDSQTSFLSCFDLLQGFELFVLANHIDQTLNGSIIHWSNFSFDFRIRVALRWFYSLRISAVTNLFHIIWLYSQLDWSKVCSVVAEPARHVSFRLSMLCCTPYSQECCYLELLHVSFLSSSWISRKSCHLVFFVCDVCHVSLFWVCCFLLLSSLSTSKWWKCMYSAIIHFVIRIWGINNARELLVFFTYGWH